MMKITGPRLISVTNDEEMLELGARKAIALSESMHPLRYLDSGIRATEKLVIREEILDA